VAYTAIPCQHCDNPACVAASRDGAVYKRKDGIVIIDPVKAKGQKEIVSACPYRVIYWNEALNLPQKCTMCAHLLDAGWKEPRCSEVCPTGTIKFGDLDDPNSEVSRLLASEKTEVMHPEYGLKEKVAYIGLPKRFIAGAVVLGDTDGCGEGASITLTGDGKTRKVTADNYGDFEFDGLPDNTEYTLKVEAKGYRPAKVTARTNNDIYLGDISLKKASK
jgi:Fe-S-cluster-containing hydrogenase component 2